MFHDLYMHYISLQPVSFFFFCHVQRLNGHATVYTHLSRSVFLSSSCWNYSTAAVISLSQSHRFDRLTEQILYVCSSVGSSMTFGHAKSKQSVETSTQQLLSGTGAGGSDHLKLEAPAACLRISVVQYNGVVRCQPFYMRQCEENTVQMKDLRIEKGRQYIVFSVKFDRLQQKTYKNVFTVTPQVGVCVCVCPCIGRSVGTHVSSRSHIGCSIPTWGQKAGPHKENPKQFSVALDFG